MSITISSFLKLGIIRGLYQLSVNAGDLLPVWFDSSKVSGNVQAKNPVDRCYDYQNVPHYAVFID